MVSLKVQRVGFLSLSWKGARCKGYTYDACSMVFSGKEGIPTLKEIRWLQHLLDTIEATDVGIDGSNDVEAWTDASELMSPGGLFLGHGVTQITYIHIHECEDFSIGVFCFPTGAKLPLHDHPGMVVLSKVMYGAVSVKAYDWINPLHGSSGRKSGLAKLASDDRILQAPCKASVLFPRGGNVHSFTARSPCAILDVLSPPYSEEMGRPSSYFSEISIPSLPGFAMLKEKEMPDDLIVNGAPYLGPKLIADLDIY